MSSFHQTPLESSNQPPSPTRPGMNPSQTSQRAGRSKTKCFSCLFILLIAIIWIITGFLGIANRNFFNGIKNGYIIRQITHIFNGSDNLLRGEKDDRINFVLLGMGGPGHDGPYLSDTIIFASARPSTGQVAIVSIPRDLIVPFGDGTYRKVNSVYALMRDRGQDYAFEQVKKIMGNSFGQEINYVATLDFQGFVNIIDAVGGVTVDVEHDFTDNSFPTADYLTTSVSFKAGHQKMNGLTALRFARSRHGNNGEGSDFARSRRQQKIILALKEKLFSFNTLINPVKITSLFNFLTQSTATDMEPWEAVKLAQMFKNIKNDNVIHQVLDDSPGNYLVGGISAIDGAYILQPKTGNYLELQKMMLNVFERPNLDSENSKIILQNGTKVPGLATIKVNELSRLGLTIQRFGNAAAQDALVTTIYDYTHGAKPKTLKTLEDYFGRTAKDKIPLEFLSYNVAKAWNFVDDMGKLQDLDFLIIVGQDAGQTASTTSGQIIPLQVPTTTPETLPTTDLKQQPN